MRIEYVLFFQQPFHHVQGCVLIRSKCQIRDCPGMSVFCAEYKNRLDISLSMAKMTRCDINCTFPPFNGSLSPCKSETSPLKCFHKPPTCVLKRRTRLHSFRYHRVYRSARAITKRDLVSSVYSHRRQVSCNFLTTVVPALCV